MTGSLIEQGVLIASLQGADISERVRIHMEQRAPAFTPLPARS